MRPIAAGWNGSLANPSGSVLVELEFGPKVCDGCGQSIPKGATARLTWGRAHTTITHDKCAGKAPLSGNPGGAVPSPVKIQTDVTEGGALPAQIHSPTSVAAAADMPQAVAHRDRVLVFMALKIAGAKGCTDEELQFLTGLEGNTERPRRIELVNSGAVQDSGTTRDTRSGRQAVVWTVVDNPVDNS